MLRYILLFFAIINIYNCKKENKNFDFISKLNQIPIKSIQIYKECDNLYIDDSLLMKPICHTIVNVSPMRLMIKYNKVDSITEKTELDFYRNFLLGYQSNTINDVREMQNIDIRVAILIDFGKQGVDTLSFVGENEIQVNESMILKYSERIKKMFRDKYINIPANK